MATTYESLNTLFRGLIDDSAKYYEDTITGDGVTVIFALTEDKIVVDSNSRVDAVYINGVLTSAYTVEANRGWITFTVAPADGDTVIVQYQSYTSFTDDELKNYLQLAVGRLNLSGYSIWTVTDTEISETLTIKDKYLLCSIGGVIINPNVRVSWQTGEIRYFSAKGKSGEALITDLINQAKIMGACEDLIVDISGINNIYNIDDELRTDEADL